MSWERSVVIKTKDEIEIMREAGRINARALDTVRKMIEPGITTAELDAAAEKVIRESGGIPTFKGYPGPYPFPATLTISINEELVHGIPNQRKLRSGDIVSIDCGTSYKGFVGDSAFTAGVGEISEEAQKLINIVRQSFFEGLKQMKAGNRVGDISSAIQEYVERFGYYVPREYTGHGVGREMHEAPQVPNYGRPGRGLALRPGLTLAVEPMVLIGTQRTKVMPDRWTVVSEDGSLTAHYEHSVAVTENGPLILTEL
ncbi:MAG: type I methionyl aminopeptidase [Gammaproteobacteria bacterium]|nr:type I methionyl aminopeptidase [Phycisphaerae bacterium]NIP50747.1 type I methionyl aminopeptidase [Phycisphaerae bacterium]NIR92428.1 type I methionyl aminopeptidase [Gammaproteobacteria bacterium]NIW46326.1 type I methionyl aminopeptidase [Gammaproteobacteria bacterium]NIX26533.1 type I methionyl aminopeptidase [Phycisphaerae bacterium]